MKKGTRKKACQATRAVDQGTHPCDKPSRMAQQMTMMQDKGCRKRAVRRRNENATEKPHLAHVDLGWTLAQVPGTDTRTIPLFGQFALHGNRLLVCEGQSVRGRHMRHIVRVVVAPSDRTRDAIWGFLMSWIAIEDPFRPCALPCTHVRLIISLRERQDEPS